MRPPDRGIGRTLVELNHPGIAERALHESVEPTILRLPVHRHVAPSEPVSRKQHIDVIVDRKVVAEVGKVARVMPRGPYEVVQAKTRKQNSAAPATANILEDEWQPHDRDVPDI